jgi:hypothetical protein
MATQVLERDTESLELDQSVVAGPSSPLVDRAPGETPRPGIMSRILNRILYALLALGQVNLFGLPDSTLDQSRGLTDQEREWLEINLRYDLHM